MSYDVRFKVKVQDKDIYIDLGYCHANTTWNVREMIVRSTGLEWKNEANNGLCKDVIPYIAHGLSELTNHPEKYKKYESPNGWGTVNGTIRFFTGIMDGWAELALNDPDLCDVATFWIE